MATETVNESDLAQPAAATRHFVTELISLHAARTPEAKALSSGSMSYTYAEVEAASDRLALELIRRIEAPNQRVGLLIERSADLVIALLAVLKSGNAFVPLEPNYPPDRLRFIATQSKLAVVLSRTTLNDRLKDADVAFIDIDDAAAAAAASPGSLPALRDRVTPEDIAYIIYTSGSTGQPKGVCVPHRGVFNVLTALSAADQFDIQSDEVHVSAATIAFDIALLEVLLPLINGAHLVIATEEEAADSRRLLRLLQHHDATFMQGTNIVWEMLMEAGWVGNPALKVLGGGEPMSRRLADRLLARGQKLFVGYGPTETSIISAMAAVGAGTEPVFIGPPIANTQFHILDERGNSVAPGEVGELYIGGEGVSLGYFGRPDLTSERFLPDIYSGVPGARLYRTGDMLRACENGHFQFCGRIDEQIKIRGFRIELGEIEAALLAQRHVKEAAVVVRGEAEGSRTIVAFVVAAESLPGAQAQSWEADLRSQLGTVLPPYMIPSSVVTLGSLPYTPNGKLDKRALSKSEALGPAAPVDVPASAMEIALRDTIARLLERGSIPFDEDIFNLGFNSLLALGLVKTLKDVLGYRVPLAAIYDHPTVSRLANWIATRPSAVAATDAGPAVAFFNLNGSRAPFIYFHNDLVADGVYCRQLVAAVGEAQPIVAVAPHGTAGLPLERTVEAMARDYVTRIREFAPSGPYRLGGLCASGLVAYEAARQLREQGERVERLILVNAWPISTRANVRVLDAIRAIALSPRLPVSVRQQFCYDVETLFELLGKGPPGFGQFVYERIASAVRRGLRILRRDPTLQSAGESRPVEMETVIAHIVAPLTYRPEPYDGPLTLFWSDEEYTSVADVRKKWLQLVPEIRIISVRGNHLSPIQAGVGDLGQSLSEMLL